MNTDPTLTPNLPATLTHASDKARAYLAESMSAATRKAYASDWRIFVVWCDSHNVASLPATQDTLALFLADDAGSGTAPNTLTRRLAAIKAAHESAGYETPTRSTVITALMRGIRRSHGTVPNRKAPATAARVQEMIAHCPGTLIGTRDRALLTLGFAGAFRRSELVGLTVADIEAVPEGLRVTIRKSKTDQESRGQTIAVLNGGRFRAAETLQAWLTAAGITEGPLFRSIDKAGRVSPGALSDRSVANIVKAYAEKAGLDPVLFSGHSLRAGFLTSAAQANANVFRMMDVSRHTRVETVRGYVRTAELFKDHAGAGFL